MCDRSESDSWAGLCSSLLLRFTDLHFPDQVDLTARVEKPQRHLQPSPQERAGATAMPCTPGKPQMAQLNQVIPQSSGNPRADSKKPKHIHSN